MLASNMVAPLWPILTLQGSEISYLKPRVLDKNFPTTTGISRSGPIEGSRLYGWKFPFYASLSDYSGLLRWASQKGLFPNEQRSGKATLMACWHLNLSSWHPMGPRLKERWGSKYFWCCMCCICDPISDYSWNSLREKKAHRKGCSKQMIPNHRTLSPASCPRGRSPDPDLGTE